MPVGNRLFLCLTHLYNPVTSRNSGPFGQMLPSAVVLLAVVALIVQVANGQLTLDGCGKIRGCWSFPSNCDSAKNECFGIVQWSHRGRALLLEWQAKDAAMPMVGRYAAIGFSKDTEMGDDTVIDCVLNADGKGDVFVSANGPSYNQRLPQASEKLLRNSSAILKDGIVQCSTQWTFGGFDSVDESERKLIEKLDGSDYNLLFAVGLVNPETGEKHIHSLRDGELYPWATLERVNVCENCDTKYPLSSTVTFKR